MHYFQQETKGAWPLLRRGHQLGWLLETTQARTNTGLQHMLTSWQQNHALHCPQLLGEALPHFSADIQQSLQLAQRIIQDKVVLDVLDEAPYLARLQHNHFEALMSSQNEGDAQEIEKITFDALNTDGELVAENLWAKFAWLSLHEDDASMRCRFSFGLEGYEDVAADAARERLAALLCQSIFPESALLHEHAVLKRFMQQVTQKEDAQFVECIAYFNAPNGGALFHQDVEAGHAGAVYAQLSGHTAWFALSTDQLIAQITLFMQAQTNVINAWHDLQQADASQLAAWLDSGDYEPLSVLLNETPRFMQQLSQQGYASILHAGDVMLLPQQSTAACAWHSVIGLGEEISHALSFAIN